MPARVSLGFAGSESSTVCVAAAEQVRPLGFGGVQLVGWHRRGSVSASRGQNGVAWGSSPWCVCEDGEPLGHSRAWS